MIIDHSQLMHLASDVSRRYQLNEPIEPIEIENLLTIIRDTINKGCEPDKYFFYYQIMRYFENISVCLKEQQITVGGMDGQQTENRAEIEADAGVGGGSSIIQGSL